MKSLIEESDAGEAPINDLLGMINRNRPGNEISNAFPDVTYVHFKNKVLDLSDFNHPGGQAIIHQLKGKDVTKYIYGSAALEYDLEVRHIHTKSALDLIEAKSIGIKTNIAAITNVRAWRQLSNHQLSR